MEVIPAPRIELSAASRAAIPAAHVLMNGQYRAAGPAQDGFLIPFTLRPYSGRVISECVMAVLACIVNATALHFDGDDVGGAMPVLAARLRIDIDALRGWRIQGHSAKK